MNNSIMAVDLGKSTMRIRVSGRGLVVKEPAIIAFNDQTNRVVGIGKSAYNLLGKTSENIIFYRPFENGTITDFAMAEYFISYYIKKIGISKLMLPNTSVALPHDMTEVQKNAVYTVFERMGFRKIKYVSNVTSGFKGAGGKFKPQTAIMLVNMGYTYTTTTILMNDEIVSREKIKVGGDDFTNSLINYVRQKYGVEIGYKMAEEAKEQIGCVYEMMIPTSYYVQGKNLMNGMLANLVITSRDTTEAFSDNMDRIIKSIEGCLEFMSPEVLGDIEREGVVLIGGTAKMNGIAPKLEMYLNTKIIVAKTPETAIIKGLF